MSRTTRRWRYELAILDETKETLAGRVARLETLLATDSAGLEALGPGSVEDVVRCERRDSALAGQGCTVPKRPRAAKRAEQSQMGGRYPHP